MEDTRHTLYSDKIEFHVIELPKLPDKLKENSSDLLLWAKFLNAERKEEFEMLAEKNVYVGKAYNKLQVISMDKKKQLEYTARQKAILDYNQLMKENYEEGQKTGYEEGQKAGFKEGQREEQYKTAKNLIKEGLGIDMISRTTGIPAEEVKNLRDNMG